MPADNGHHLAIHQLRRIAAASNGALVIAETGHLPPEAASWNPPTGYTCVELTISFPDAGSYGDGITLARYERTAVFIPPDFPVRHPEAAPFRDDLGGLPHVLWGRWICLYAGENDWDIGRGMYGFVPRLIEWYERAADGALTMDGQPLHPPVTYGWANAPCVVVEPELPTSAHLTPQPWLGAAIVRRVTEGRSDVVGWLDLMSLTDPGRGGPTAVGLVADEAGDDWLAPAVMLTAPMSFEFPRGLPALIAACAERDVDDDRLLSLLTLVSQANVELLRRRRQDDVDAKERLGTMPSYFVLGSPARAGDDTPDPPLYLAAWRLTDRDVLMGNLLGQFADPAAALLTAWIRTVRCEWAIVYDRRGSTTRRRDNRPGTRWLRGRHVLILGCGALGAPIAEACARAGVAALALADSGRVGPGLLVRQPYHEFDIGRPKPAALADRLVTIQPRCLYSIDTGDIRDGLLDDLLDGNLPPIDLIIDATASQPIATLLEAYARKAGADRPPILSVGIGFTAERGVTTLSLPGASGAGIDILRRTAIELWQKPDVREAAEDLFPVLPGRDPFQPEYGCSATFLGSAAECIALAGALFSGALRDLDEPGPWPMSSRVVDLSDSGVGVRRFGWPSDHVVADVVDGYQVRFAVTAIEQMWRECRDVVERAPVCETGGVLLGQVDDACRTVWVTIASGPPTDSDLAADHFWLGTEGVDDLVARHREDSGGRVILLGYWHTHPFGSPHPSDVDRAAFDNLRTRDGSVPARLLMTILADPDPAAWLTWIEDGDPPSIYAALSDSPLPPV